MQRRPSIIGGDRLRRESLALIRRRRTRSRLFGQVRVTWLGKPAWSRLRRSLLNVLSLRRWLSLEWLRSECPRLADLSRTLLLVGA